MWRGGAEFQQLGGHDRAERPRRTGRRRDAHRTGARRPNRRRNPPPAPGVGRRRRLPAGHLQEDLLERAGLLTEPGDVDVGQTSARLIRAAESGPAWTCSFPSTTDTRSGPSSPATTAAASARGSASMTRRPSPTRSPTVLCTTRRPCETTATRSQHLLHLGEQVAGQDDGAAFRGERPQQGPHVGDAGRVESVRRFVEDDDLGLLEQGRGDAQALLHAHGVRAVAVVGPVQQVDRCQHLRDPGVGGAGVLREDPEVVPAGQEGVEARPLDERADPRDRLTGGTAEYPCRPAGRAHQTHEHAQRRRLAGAVRPQEAEHLAATHRQRQPFDGRPGSIALGEALGDDGGLTCVCAGAESPTSTVAMEGMRRTVPPGVCPVDGALSSPCRNRPRE